MDVSPRLDWISTSVDDLYVTLNYAQSIDRLKDLREELITTERHIRDRAGQKTRASLLRRFIRRIDRPRKDTEQ